MHVELAAGDADQVTGAAAQDRLVPEQLAQPRHEHLKVVRGARRRLRAPDLLDQGVGRDDLVRADKERREQRALLRAPQGERSPVVENLEVAEDAVLHRRSFDRAPALCKTRSGAGSGALQHPSRYSEAAMNRGEDQ